MGAEISPIERAVSIYAVINEKADSVHSLLNIPSHSFAHSMFPIFFYIPFNLLPVPKVVAVTCDMCTLHTMWICAKRF